MAYYVLRVSILTKGKRNSVVRAAAYRAGANIHSGPGRSQTSLKIEFHPKADEELRAAARYYDVSIPGLGSQFISAVEALCNRLRSSAELGPKLNGNLRRLALSRFPFGLIHRSTVDTVQSSP
jgi:hypothetical protein